MRRFHEQAGLTILAERPCAMAMVAKGLSRLGMQPYVCEVRRPLGIGFN